MGRRFLHSVSTVEQSIAVDGVVTFDLAVNPLSVVHLVLRPLNDTGTLADFPSYLEVVGALNRINIAWLGSSIFNMSGRDAAALAYFRHGLVPRQVTHIDTDDFRRCVVLPIFLGRDAFDEKSCFPASKRGELTIELDFDVADAGYDGMRLSIESLELLDAKPTEYERKVTSVQTFAATGDNDLDMPPGLMYRGILLFGTTSFTGATPAPTLGRISTRLDNSEVLYSSTDFEVAHTLGSLFGGQPPIMDEHIHRVDATAASVIEPTTLPSQIGGGGWQNYAWLDFDPTRDDRFSLDTRGKSRFHVRSNAEAAELVRAIGIEVVKV